MVEIKQIVSDILINNFKKNDYEKLNKISTIILISGLILGTIFLIFLSIASGVAWITMITLGCLIIIGSILINLFIVIYGSQKNKKIIFKIANEERQKIYLLSSKQFNINLFITDDGYCGKYKEKNFQIDLKKTKLIINDWEKSVDNYFFNYKVYVDQKNINKVTSRYYISLIDNLSTNISTKIISDFKYLIKEIDNENN